MCFFFRPLLPDHSVHFFTLQRNQCLFSLSKQFIVCGNDFCSGGDGVTRYAQAGAHTQPGVLRRSAYGLRVARRTGAKGTLRR